MKVWKRLKQRADRMIQARVWERANWVPTGYYNHRPHIWPVTDGIGSVEDVRFVLSPGAARCAG